jgi:hypothetical protein
MKVWVLGVWLLSGPSYEHHQLLRYYAKYPTEQQCSRAINGPRYRGGTRRQIRGHDWISVGCMTWSAQHLAYDVGVARRADPGQNWRNYR